jgi:regulator of replication initiation timing
MRDDALKLADELLRDNTQLTVESAHLIRRLVAENEFLKDWKDTWSPYVNQLKEGKE